MIEDLSIKEYHELNAISSTILKTITISPAHLEYALSKKFAQTKATALGDAVHAYILEPNRFKELYKEVAECYQRASGVHKAGDLKMDENGDWLIYLQSLKDGVLDIKGEEYKKFQAMVKAYNESDEAKSLVAKAKYIECTFLYMDYKVRPDFITEDGWIVDIKTVGGSQDKPSAPERFGRDFFGFGYDIQMFMYYNIVKKEIPDIKGFKFLCLDAKCPSGVQIYTFVNGESKWFELGGHRFARALKLYKNYQNESKHKVYESDIAKDLPLSWEAEQLLAEYRNE